MTKTKTKPRKMSVAELEQKASAYREKWLRKTQLEQELKQMREEIGAFAEDYFAKNPSEKMSIRLGGCVISHKLVSIVLLPEEMKQANSARFIKFCRAYPQAVKFELKKSSLPNIPLADWGIEVAEGRKVEVEVADREEVSNGKL